MSDGFARRIRRCLSVRWFGAQLALCGFIVAGAATTIPRAAVAQIVQRVVEGKVQLSDGSMAKGAIVYLKNAKTLEVRTYISTEDGSYRFGQLNPDADYILWAEYQGKKSKERSVSSFDTKKTFEITLKVSA